MNDFINDMPENGQRCFCINITAGYDIIRSFNWQGSEQEKRLWRAGKNNPLYRIYESRDSAVNALKEHLSGTEEGSAYLKELKEDKYSRAPQWRNRKPEVGENVLYKYSVFVHAATIVSDSSLNDYVVIRVADKDGEMAADPESIYPVSNCYWNGVDWLELPKDFFAKGEEDTTSEVSE